jgi:hypothetical protein
VGTHAAAKEGWFGKDSERLSEDGQCPE